jgi:Flp pilus assembly protein TadG
MKGTEVFFKRLKRGTTKGEKGQSLAEFVMVLPIFLILVFAIMDFGMGFHAWLTVTNSAREGARLGAVRAPAGGACDNDPSTATNNIDCRVRETADSLDQSKLTPSITNAQGTPGTSVVVKVDYEYDLITPLDSVLGLISGGSIGPTLTFSSTADMRLE